MSTFSGFNSTAKTPCRENRELYSSELMESFDSQSFIEENDHLTPDELEIQLASMEARHKMLSKGAIEKAVSLCNTCPVINECFEWVLKMEDSSPSNTVFGVVAGMTPKQRRKVLRMSKNA